MACARRRVRLFRQRPEKRGAARRQAALGIIEDAALIVVAEQAEERLPERPLGLAPQERRTRLRFVIVIQLGLPRPRRGRLQLLRLLDLLLAALLRQLALLLLLLLQLRLLARLLLLRILLLRIPLLLLRIP